MKKFVLWLIKIFNLDILTVKYLPSNTVIKKEYVLKSTKYNHSLTIEGDLLVEGNLDVKGEIACFNKEALKWHKLD